MIDTLYFLQAIAMFLFYLGVLIIIVRMIFRRRRSMADHQTFNLETDGFDSPRRYYVRTREDYASRPTS